jgi:tetratricopeptide (TPR) repeat protein
MELAVWGQMVEEFFELNFGDSHVQTLSAKSMLAATLRDQGRTQESLTLQESISGLKKSTFGPHSTEYLSSLGELAMAYDSAGQWYNAEKGFLEALTELQANPRQDATLTIFWERHLGHAYAKNGDYETAKKFQLMVIDRLEASKGKNHFDTLTRMLDLVEFYVLKKKSTQALKTVCTVLSRQISALLASVSVPAEIAIERSISHMTMEDGKPEEQIPPALSFKDFNNKVENSVALDALAIYNNSAVILVKLGHPEKGWPFIIEVLDGYTALYGPDEESTLEISRNMAAILHRMGDIEAAETILQSMRKGQSSKHGTESVKLLPITEALAAMMDDQNRPDASIPLHEEALQMNLKFLGPVHPNTLQRIHTLSMVYLKKKDWTKIESLKYDLFFSDKNRAELSPEKVLLSGSLLHKAYEGQDEWPKSVRVIKQMIQTAEGAYGRTSTRVLLFRARLATVLVRMHEMEQSISISTDIMQELSTTRGHSNHTVVLDTLSCLAMDYFDHGRPEACDKLLVKVIEDASEALGAEHRITQVSQGNLEGVRCAVARGS